MGLSSNTSPFQSIPPRWQNTKSKRMKIRASTQVRRTLMACEVALGVVHGLTGPPTKANGKTTSAMGTASTQPSFTSISANGSKT